MQGRAARYVEWRNQPPRDHAYMIEKMPPERVARRIETLMLHRPRHASGASHSPAR